MDWFAVGDSFNHSPSRAPTRVISHAPAVTAPAVPHSSAPAVLHSSAPALSHSSAPAALPYATPPSILPSFVMPTVTYANNNNMPNKPSTNGTMSASGAFYEWDKQLVKLPTPQRISSIFTKLAQFDILNTLPQRLEYRSTAADQAIVQNIRKLFDSSAESVAPIVRDALLLVVSRIDAYMTESQKTQIDRQKSSLNKEQQRHILLFYPNLMALIRVLLIHCQNLVKNAAPVTDDGVVSMRKCVLDMWQQILGELHELHFVILYASRMELVSLDNYPSEWMQLIQHMNADYDRLRNTILELQESLNHNLLFLNERDKQLQAVNSKFADIDSRVQFIRAELSNTLATLESCTSVPILVNENMLRLQSALGSLH